MPIEIVALQLESVQPVTVTYNGGQDPELWDLTVCLSDLGQSQGQITIRLDYSAGGTFDAELPVQPKLIFTRIDDMTTRVIDPAPLLNFQVFDTRWVYFPDLALNVLRPIPGAVTDGNCDGVADAPLESTSNFAPGVWSLVDECGIPSRPQVKRLSLEEELLASHGVIIAQVPPPDGDGDGIGDDADNCPAVANALQEDADNDSVGDACDNCPLFNPCQEDDDLDGIGNACEVFEDGFEGVIP